jgi:hypothetical protein
VKSVLVALVMATGIMGVRADLQSVSYSSSFPIAPDAFLTPDWSSTIALPKFNPALGTLQVVSFDMTGFVSGDAKTENTSPSSPADVKLTLSASMALRRPGGGAPLVVATPLAVASYTLPPFDGVVDFAGASGPTTSGLLGSKFNRWAYTDAADKALFSRPGTIALPVNAVGASRAVGGASAINLFDTAARAEVTVTYRYTPSPVIPEPRVYGAIGAALCLGFAAFRRSRAKRS